MPPSRSPPTRAISAVTANARDLEEAYELLAMLGLLAADDTTIEADPTGVDHGP